MLQSAPRQLGHPMGKLSNLSLPLSLCGKNLSEPKSISLPEGEAVVFSCSLSKGQYQNEDGLGVFSTESRSLCFAIADGVGGLPKGRQASEMTINMLENLLSSTNNVKIHDHIKEINKILVEQIPTSATTISAVEIIGNSLSSFHAGDSASLLVGQRGRIKLKTQCHSPVGISEANGLLSENEALLHPRRHLLNNMLGDPAFWLEINGPIKLYPRDTLLMATDGLWDNLFLSEIINCIRVGTLIDVAGYLVKKIRDRINNPTIGMPSKPDDLSFILYRRDTIAR